MSGSDAAVRRAPPRAVAPLGFALVLGAGYIALDVWQPAEPLLSILAFVPGLLGVAALTLAGFSREELRLQFRPLSRAGATALAVTTVLLLPILLSNSGFLGWRWLPALIWAPASGIAQELYFRGTLLPGLERAIGNRRWALLAHLPVFVLFHLRLYLALPSVPIALLCTLVLGAAGFSWGWQVQRDDTLVWAIAQHSVFLMLMSLFAFG